MNDHDLEKTATGLRKRILQYTGVPVCIGIGAAKTLAKIANKTVKKQCPQTSVFYMDTPDKIETS
ncbi:hypothetical protein [Pedobacter sp.]|uniref:Y-family DNA polymerase n=1 Tax=Pedobacter sp. TaxID=1411316 RepID=UPI0039C9A19F